MRALAFAVQQSCQCCFATASRPVAMPGPSLRCGRQEALLQSCEPQLYSRRASLPAACLQPAKESILLGPPQTPVPIEMIDSASLNHR